MKIGKLGIYIDTDETRPDTTECHHCGKDLSREQMYIDIIRSGTMPETEDELENSFVFFCNRCQTKRRIADRL